jgi:hypothetical protein
MNATATFFEKDYALNYFEYMENWQCYDRMLKDRVDGF